MLAFGNFGVRVQPSNMIHEYVKQDASLQTAYRLNSDWTATLAAQVRRKTFPNNRRANYLSGMLDSRLSRRFGLSSVGGGYQVRSYTGAIDPRVLLADVNRDMEGVRHVARVWWEHLLSGALLLRATYRTEIDVATRDLQVQDRFQREPEQHSRFDDEDEADFNFINLRPSISVVWRIAGRASLHVSARHHAKYFRDWVVPGTSTKRRDNLTLVRWALRRSFGSLLSGQVEYTLERNRSNDPGQEYSANSYSLLIQALY